VRPLCFWCQDHGLLHTRRPVRTLHDLKGLKLRFPTRLAGETLRALGARSVGAPVAQIRWAVVQRAVDGCVMPWGAMPPLKLQELLKFHTEIAGPPTLTTATSILAMNKRSYERLPAELKKAIDDNSGEAAAGMAGAMWDGEAESVAGNARERGDTLTTLAPEEAARWRKATDPVIESWLKHMKERRIDGGKLLASARTLIAKYEEEPQPQREGRPAPKPEAKPEAEPEAKPLANPQPTARPEGQSAPAAVEPPKTSTPRPPPPPTPSPPPPRRRIPPPVLNIPL
jgi:TRAP-type C4-dicarboxylate transport system substrate-binding protein